MSDGRCRLIAFNAGSLLNLHIRNMLLLERDLTGSLPADALTNWLTPLVEAGADIPHCSQRQFRDRGFPEIYVDPSDVERRVADARATIPGAHADDGCLFRCFTLDDPAIGCALMPERWRDQDALSADLAKPRTVALSTR